MHSNMNRWNITNKNSKTLASHSQDEGLEIHGTQHGIAREAYQGEKIDEYLMAQSKRFMKYRLNVFLLHRVSLYIINCTKGCPQNLALVLRDSPHKGTDGASSK